jgi:CheY-like chemotaxis protein
MAEQLSLFLVDDDPDDTFLFGDVLRDVAPGIKLHTAGDGQEALDKLKGGMPLPDLLFLDLNMPRMGGIECLAVMKRDEALKNIPVIIYTTSSQSKDIEETIQKGAVCFITKPSNIRELTEILAAITHSLPNQLQIAIRNLSNKGTHFIIC